MRAPSSLSHCGNYGCDYLSKIAPVCVLHSHKVNGEHVNICRCSESDHELALVPIKGSRWKLLSPFLVLSVALCLCRETARLYSQSRDPSALCCVTEEKQVVNTNELRGVESNYNLLLIPRSSESQRFSLSLLTSPPQCVCACVSGS